MSEPLAMVKPVDVPNYGVWLPRRGWLRADGYPYAETLLSKARSTARRLGSGARVEYIDASLVKLESQFLEAELQSSLKFRTTILIQRTFTLFARLQRGAKWLISKKLNNR